MKKGNVLAIAMFAGLLTITSCASKKDLENCRLENRELSGNYQDTKEQLAASKARVASLEDQLAQARRIMHRSRVHLTRASTTQAQTTLISLSSLTRLTSLTSTYATWLRLSRRATHSTWCSPTTLHARLARRR